MDKVEAGVLRDGCDKHHRAHGSRRMSRDPAIGGLTHLPKSPLRSLCTDALGLGDLV
jgi:hypothetical protein